ncbi:HU family DNA-binding protein [uncultured Draconibacterium sp.]|uniref:HU family DNA-binding protein n=1 Tax=uncultured Draconibacterium sp. TaxID=1573823 RepID=UPI0029C981B8|nr:HU family DNA-binding protein [uncultured Draconibacterium sp.]
MSILYSKIQRVNPRNPQADRKWYLVPNRVEQKTEKEIAEALSKNTTLSRGEAALVIDELQAVIQNALLDGYSVQMGDWGSFQLTFNCTGTDTEAECTADKITSVNIRFRPGKQMKEAMSKATFVAR